MRFGEREIGVRKMTPAVLVVAALFVSSLMSGGAQAQDKTYVMKITLPTLNETQHTRQEFRRGGGEGFRRPHQGRGLSEQPTRFDFAANRRHAVRRHPGRASFRRSFLSASTNGLR